MSTRPNPNPQSNGEEDEEINVSLRIKKTVSFKVNRCMSVRGVKALLYEKEKIPECMQELFYNGNHLENDSKMVDHGITTNSAITAYVINAVPLKLFIKIPHRYDSLMVQIRSQDMIQNIKSVIQTRENIPSESHSLVHAGKLLEEDKTIAFLGIRDGETLHLAFIPQGMFQISVKLLNGETVKMQVNMRYTVLDVKVLLESIIGYPVGGLTYEGKILSNIETLQYHKIGSDSIVELAPPSAQICQIFIKISGKSVAFEVCLGDSVEHLKKMISSRMRIPDNIQMLVFEGKRLEDGKDLASYGVHKDFIIFLSSRISTTVLSS